MKIRQTELLPLSGRIRQQDREIRPTEFAEYLQAKAARGGGRIGFGNHHQSANLLRSCRHGRADSDAFRADGSTEASVLDVASGMDLTALHQHGGTHPKTAVGGVGTVSRVRCGLDEGLPIHGVSIYHGAEIAVLDCRKAIIGDASGNTVTFGSEIVFDLEESGRLSVAMLSDAKIVVAYSNSAGGAAVIGDITENNITFGSQFTFDPSASYVSVVGLSETGFAVAYQSSIEYGKAIFGDTDCANVIGIAKESGTQLETVPVIISGVSDVHSDLLPGELYYSHTSGNLTTYVSDWPVGLALSATEILIDIDRYAH